MNIKTADLSKQSASLEAETNSELSDLENAEKAATTVSTKVDLQPPPFFEIMDGPEYLNAQVNIEIHANQRVKGRLVKFDPSAELLAVAKASSSSPVEIDLNAIKFMRLDKPYQVSLESPQDDEERPDIKLDTEARSFQVFFKDHTELTGKTLGTRIDKNGVHFYEQQKKGRKWRYCTHLFVSRNAIENYIVGEQIGNMLVRENAISQGDLEDVLEEQQKERSALLGDYLLENNVVDGEQLEKMLARQKAMPNVKLGEILVTENLITDEQLQDALSVQKRKRKNSLGEILVNKGAVKPEQIQQCLAKKMGIPYISLRQFKIEPHIIQLLPADVAFGQKVVPLYVYRDKVAVAIENPMDWQVIDLLRHRLKKHIEPIMSSAEDINWALHFYFNADDIPAQTHDATIEFAEDEEFDVNLFAATDISQVTSSSVMRIVNKIIEDAHRQKVSVIHIEPGSGTEPVIVRFRKDGVLTVYYKFPGKFRAVFASRIKMMAHLDVSDKVTPRKGKINFGEYGAADIKLQITVVPTSSGGEDVVIKLLASGRCMPISATGLSSDNLASVLDMVSRPQGLLLLTGPAGAGKVTTLHAILNHLNHQDKKIWTLEESVGISQPGIRQIEVNDKSEISYGETLKSIMGADPDIIMLSDMRDRDTTALAVQAALSGQMILSALPSANPLETLQRMLDLGIKDLDLADSLMGVLSQRLVKTLCASCKKPYRPELKEIIFLAEEYCRDLPDFGLDGNKDKDLINTQVKDWQENLQRGDHHTFYKAPGCPDCRETGYRGYIGVHELLVVGPEVKQLVMQKASMEEIEVAARESGMRTLRQDGIEKVLLGYTDFSQVRMH